MTDDGNPNPVIRRLLPGPVDGVFRLTAAEAKVSKRGYPYLSLRFTDASGSIAARRWRVGEGALEALREHEFLRVRGVVEVWDGVPQVRVEELEPLAESELEALDRSLFVEQPRLDADAAFAWLQGKLEALEDPWLRAICLSYLADEAFAERLRTMPGSTWRHHAYTHGYLAHLCSMLRRGLALWSCDDWMDVDLIVAGIFLHDSGKVHELSDDPEPTLTLEGRLLGHIPLGLAELHRRLSLIEGFPRQRRLQLEHIILSHHESSRYGSTKPPAFAEAEVIRAIEGLDYRLEVFHELRASGSGGDGEEDGEVVESERLRRWVYRWPEVAEELDDESR